MTSIQDIKAVIEKVNGLQTDDAVASVSCFACNADGSVDTDEEIQAALEDGTFRLAMDIETYKTFSQKDEAEASVGVSKIESAVEAMPEVVSLDNDGDGDGSTGHIECYNIELDLYFTPCPRRQ